MNEYGKRVAKKMENFMDEPDSVDREINDIQNAIEGIEVRGALAAGVKKSFDKSKTAEGKSVEAYDITQNLLDESFDTSVINQNFEQRLDNKIANLQPEWTQFKEDTVTQLADTVLGINENTIEVSRDSEGKVSKISELRGNEVVKESTITRSAGRVTEIDETVLNKTTRYLFNRSEGRVSNITKEVL